MSVASTAPSAPARRPAASVCPPAPAAMSSTRLPADTLARSSMRSVAGPSHLSMVGPQACQRSAADSHWAVVARLYATGSNCCGTVVIVIASTWVCVERGGDRMSCIPWSEAGRTLEPLAATRIQLCGPLVVEWRGERREAGLPGRQGRLLFAYLVLNRSRVTTRDALVEAVWPTGAPPATETALAALLSKLRKVVGAEHLVGRGELRYPPSGGHHASISNWPGSESTTPSRPSQPRTGREPGRRRRRPCLSPAGGSFPPKRLTGSRSAGAKLTHSTCAPLRRTDAHASESEERRTLPP